jgi:hypothetical protein
MTESVLTENGMLKPSFHKPTSLNIQVQRSKAMCEVMVQIVRNMKRREAQGFFILGQALH